jgi:hypothetical protein
MDLPGAGQIPSRFDARTLAAELSLRLAGRPADGSRAATSLSGGPLQQVVWVDAGDEVLVHLDSVAVRIVGRTVLVSVDLECDQTGRTPLIVSLALSAGTDAAGLLAVTDELPRGNGLLAARWGPQLQAAAWASILGIAQDFGAQQGGVPRALTVVDGGLNLQAGPPLQATTQSNPILTGADINDPYRRAGG